MEDEHSEESERITLIDETGAERAFDLHDAFDFEGVTYYLVEAADDASMVLLLRESEGALESVEPEEFDRVVAGLEAQEGG